MTSSQTTSFNRQRTLKTALCTVLLLALSLAIIMPASADTWSLSAKPNSATYVQGEQVTITGTLTDTTTGAAGANYLVTVFVYDSAGKLAYSTIVATGTAGTYSTQFHISSTDPNGTYTISAGAVETTNGATLATAKATFSVGSTPTATPIATSSTSPSPTPKIPEFPSAIIVTILLIAIATAILFCKRRKI